MQTWLPSPDFRESASLLTDEQLALQCVEGVELLDMLTGVEPATEDPTVVIWTGYAFGLVTYLVAMMDEFIARGGADLKTGLLERVADDMGMDIETVEGMAHQDVLMSEAYEDLHALPPWLGKGIHQHHREILGLALEPNKHKENKVSDTSSNENMNRGAVVDALRAAGYDGPTSYTKTRLLEMLATVQAGGTIEVPKRGRRSREASETEGTPEPAAV